MVHRSAWSEGDTPVPTDQGTITCYLQAASSVEPHKMQPLQVHTALTLGWYKDTIVEPYKVYPYLWIKSL